MKLFELTGKFTPYKGKMSNRWFVIDTETNDLVKKEDDTPLAFGSQKQAMEYCNNPPTELPTPVKQELPVIDKTDNIEKTDLKPFKICDEKGNIVKSCSTLNRARLLRDRMNMEYGSDNKYRIKGHV